MNGMGGDEGPVPSLHGEDVLQRALRGLPGLGLGVQSGNQSYLNDGTRGPGNPRDTGVRTPEEVRVPSFCCRRPCHLVE